MTILFTNNGTSTLGAPISASDTTMTLSAGTGGRFPNPGAGDYFFLTLTNPGQEVEWEIVKVTARNSDVLTIERGQDGTVSKSWAFGDLAELRLTKGGIEAIKADTLTNPTIVGSPTEQVFAITGTSPVLSPDNGSIQTWSLSLGSSGTSTPTFGSWDDGQSMTLMISDGGGLAINWGTVYAAPQVIGTISANFGINTTGVIDIPGTAQQDDIVIVAVGSDGSLPVTPAGWTQLLSVSTSGTENVMVAYKVMGFSPDTSVSLSGLSTASVGMVTVVRKGNVDRLKLASSSGASGMPSAPQVTVDTSTSIILALGFLDDDNVSTGLSAPSGYTLLAAQQASVVGQTVMAAYRVVDSGTHTPGAFVGTGTDEWVGMSIVIPGNSLQGGVEWKTDNGRAPTLNRSSDTAISLWKVGSKIYGARIGGA
jgi:hypothetical protein